jgi:hypothetical protein
MPGQGSCQAIFLSAFSHSLLENRSRNPVGVDHHEGHEAHEGRKSSAEIRCLLLNHRQFFLLLYMDVALAERYSHQEDHGGHEGFGYF